jgi:hypothetical protein
MRYSLRQVYQRMQKKITAGFALASVVTLGAFAANTAAKPKITTNP